MLRCVADHSMVLIDCFIVFYQSYCPGWDGLKFGPAWFGPAWFGPARPIRPWCQLLPVGIEISVVKRLSEKILFEKRLSEKRPFE